MQFIIDPKFTGLGGLGDGGDPGLYTFNERLKKCLGVLG